MWLVRLLQLCRPITVIMPYCLFLWVVTWQRYSLVIVAVHHIMFRVLTYPALVATTIRLWSLPPSPAIASSVMLVIIQPKYETVHHLSLNAIILFAMLLWYVFRFLSCVIQQDCCSQFVLWITQTSCQMRLSVLSVVILTGCLLYHLAAFTLVCKPVRQHQGYPWLCLALWPCWSIH